MEVTPSTLAQSEAGLARLDDFGVRTSELARGAVAEEATLDRFRERMDDDLDTPRAMALLFDTVHAANRSLDAGDAQAAGELAAAVGVMASAVGLALRGTVEVPPQISALVERREAARDARDFFASDSIRDQLLAAGWVVEDTPQGPRVRQRP
jgi:cysteinyl-tRNA synthetase